MNDITKYPIDAEAFSQNVGNAMRSVAEAVNKICGTLSELVSNMSKGLEPLVTIVAECLLTSKALNWAKNNAPKLYHYAVYSKRSRIRRKYSKKIKAMYMQLNERILQ